MKSWASRFVFVLPLAACFVLLIAATTSTTGASEKDSGSIESTVLVVEKASSQYQGAQYHHGFPDDSAMHASCRLSVLLPNISCIDAKAQAKNLIETNVDTGSEFKGTMSVLDQGGDWIWSSRLTYNKKYTDDQLFEFDTTNTPPTGTTTSCLIKARSRSRSLSVLDYGVNYCNMWNVLSRLSGFDSPDTDPAIVSHCNSENIPVDPETTCVRY
mmetsp:Transcript_4264/g.9245  ORF Transcript_4264/g.9245 Transcript_4264/m.9245 type:complete len:214 (+) Transcript_4264:112-753(+)